MELEKTRINIFYCARLPKKFQFTYNSFKETRSITLKVLLFPTPLHICLSYLAPFLRPKKYIYDLRTEMRVNKSTPESSLCILYLRTVR